MKKKLILLPILMLSTLTGCEKYVPVYTITHDEIKAFLDGDTSFTLTVKDKRNYKTSYLNGESDYSATTTYKKSGVYDREEFDCFEYITFTTQGYMDFYALTDEEQAKNALLQINDVDCINLEQGIWRKLDKNGAPTDTIQKKTNDGYRIYDNLEKTYCDISNEESEGIDIYREYYYYICYYSLFDYSTYNEEGHYYELTDVNVLREFELLSETGLSGSMQFYFLDKKPVKIILNTNENENYQGEEVITFSDIGNTSINVNESEYTPEED